MVQGLNARATRARGLGAVQGVRRLACETGASAACAAPRRILQGAGAAIAAALIAVASPAWAAGPAVVVVKHGETVTIDGVRNIVMRADQAKGGILLLTGGDGRLNVTDGAQFTDGADNVLIRNCDAFAARGYNVMLVDLGTDLAAAVGYMARLKAPVTVIGTSKGTERLAQGLAKGARPDKVVLSSGFLSPESGPGDSVQAILGTPSRLPPTLAIHHREDHCRWTRPAGVEPFKAWAGPKVEVAWLSGGVDDQANPCRYSGHHGFAGVDAAFVDRIMAFVAK
ncbi:MAG: hypothetical protein KA134_04315 [Achromobacter sp.]|nr:hypothetical protein [Achromobacter sp.]